MFKTNTGMIDATVDSVKVKIYNGIEHNMISLTYSYSMTIIIIPNLVRRALVDGFSVVLEPPKPNTHDVRLKVSVLNPIKASYNYDTDWTYYLIITNSSAAK